MTFDPAGLVSLLALCAEPGTWASMLAGLTTQTGIAVSLFIAGLISGVTHCSGMCGPFVLMRIVAREGDRPAGGSAIGRLGRAALWRYHLGRTVTYSALGAVAARTTGAMFGWLGFRWVVAGLLIAATAYMVVAALRVVGLAGPLVAGRAGGILPRAVTALAARAGQLGDFPLGLALGLLPCGIVYGALAAAASTGDAVSGAMAMASFALGTFPGLVAVGLGGAFFARRWRGARAVVLPLATLNIAIVAAFVLKAIA